MIPHHVYYQLAIVGLLWFCIMLHSIWPSRNAVLPQLRTEPVPSGSNANAPTNLNLLQVSRNVPIATRVSTPPRRAPGPPAPRHRISCKS